MKFQAVCITAILIGVLSKGINGQNVWFGPMSIPFRPWELKGLERSKHNNANPWRQSDNQVKSTDIDELKGNRPPFENKLQSTDINLAQQTGVNGIQHKTGGWSSIDIQNEDNNHSKVELHKKPFRENNVGIRLEVNPESKQLSIGDGMSTPKILLTGWKPLEDGITVTAHDLTLSDLNKLQQSGILTTTGITHSAWNQKNNGDWPENENKQRDNRSWETNRDQYPNRAGWKHEDGTPQQNKQNWRTGINHKYANEGWIGEKVQGVINDAQTPNINFQNNQEGWISAERKQTFDNSWFPEMKKQVTDTSRTHDGQTKHNANDRTLGINKQNIKEDWTEEINKQTADGSSILNKIHRNSDGRWTSEQDKQTSDSRWVPDEQKKYNPEIWTVGVNQQKTEVNSAPEEQAHINDSGWVIRGNNQMSNHPQNWTPEQNYNQNQLKWNDENYNQNDRNANKHRGYGRDEVGQEKLHGGDFDVNQPQVPNEFPDGNNWNVGNEPPINQPQIPNEFPNGNNWNVGNEPPINQPQVPNEFPNENNWNVGNEPPLDNKNWKSEENGNQDWNEGNKQHDGWTANPINQERDYIPFIGKKNFDETGQRNGESRDNNKSGLPVYPNTPPDISWKSDNRDTIKDISDENNKPDGNFPGDYRKDTAEFGSNYSPPSSPETRAQLPTLDDARNDFNFASAIEPPREDANSFDGVGQRGDTALTLPPYPTRIPQGNYKGGDESYPDDGHEEPSYENTIPGTAGINYPNYAFIPETGFECENQNYPGYFADIETGCQVYHVCQSDGRHNSFLCPTGTIFNQKLLTCDWWYHYDCQDAVEHYPLNQMLFREVDNYKGTRYPGSRNNAPSSIPQVVNLRPEGDLIPNSEYDDTRSGHTISTGDSKNVEGEFHGLRGETFGMVDIPPTVSPMYNVQEGDAPGQIYPDGRAKNFQGGFQEAGNIDELPVIQNDLPYYEHRAMTGGVTQGDDLNVNNFSPGDAKKFGKDENQEPWNQNNDWTKNDQQQMNQDINPNFYSQMKTNEDNKWITNNAYNPVGMHNNGWSGNINRQDVQHKISEINKDYDDFKAGEGHQNSQDELWETRRNDDALWDKDIQDKWNSQGQATEVENISQKDLHSLANPGASEITLLYDQSHEENNRKTVINLDDGLHRNVDKIGVFTTEQDRTLAVSQEEENLQSEVNNAMSKGYDQYPYDPIFTEQSKYSNAPNKKFILDGITSSEGLVNQDAKNEYSGRILQTEITSRDIPVSERNIAQDAGLRKKDHEAETPFSKINIENPVDGPKMDRFHSERSSNSAYRNTEDDYNAQESKTFHVSAIAPVTTPSSVEGINKFHSRSGRGSVPRKSMEKVKQKKSENISTVSQIVSRKRDERLKVSLMHQNKSADNVFIIDSAEQDGQQRKIPAGVYKHFAATHENDRKNGVKTMNSPISTDSVAFLQRKTQIGGFSPRNGEVPDIKNYTVNYNENSAGKKIAENPGEYKSKMSNLTTEITARFSPGKNAGFEGNRKIMSSYKSMRENSGKEITNKKVESVSGNSKQHLRSVNLRLVVRPKYVNKNSYRRFQEQDGKNANFPGGEKISDFHANIRGTPVRLKNGAWKKRIIIINQRMPDYNSSTIANSLSLKQDNVPPKTNPTINSTDKRKYLLNPAGRNKSIDNPNFTHSNLYEFPFNYNVENISKYRSKPDAKEDKKDNSIYFKLGQNIDVNERQNLKEFNTEANSGSKVQRELAHTRNALKTNMNVGRNGESRAEMKGASYANENNTNLQATLRPRPSEGIKEQSYPWKAANTVNRWRINVYKRRKSNISNIASAETSINNRNDNQERTHPGFEINASGKE